jgi:hypothetical protein
VTTDSIVHTGNSKAALLVVDREGQSAVEISLVFSQIRRHGKQSLEDSIQQQGVLYIYILYKEERNTSISMQGDRQFSE